MHLARASRRRVADAKKPKAAKKAVYILEPDEIVKLRAALDVPWERVLVCAVGLALIRCPPLAPLRFRGIPQKCQPGQCKRSAHASDSKDQHRADCRGNHTKCE